MLTRFANDIVTVVEYLGMQPVLVGASLGGAASLAALGAQPTLAQGLVLVDVAPFIRVEGASKIRQSMMAAPEGFSSVDEAADAVASYLPHRLRPRNLDGLRRNLREFDGRLFWHLVPGGKSDVLGVDEVRYFLDLVPHAEFAAVDGAHHMVAGDDDAVFGALLGDFLERRIRTRLAQFMA